MQRNSNRYQYFIIMKTGKLLKDFGKWVRDETRYFDKLVRKPNTLEWGF